MVTPWKPHVPVDVPGPGSRDTWIWRRRFLDAVAEELPEVLRSLPEMALDEWAEKYNLRCPWVLEAAGWTMRWWRDYCAREPHPQWPGIWSPLAREGDEPQVTLSDLRPPRWDALAGESEKEFNERHEVYKRKVKERLRVALERGELVQPPEVRDRLISAEDRMRFLVLHVVGKRTIAELANEYADEKGNPSEKAIRECVTALARRIGLPLPGKLSSGP